MKHSSKVLQYIFIFQFLNFLLTKLVSHWCSGSQTVGHDQWITTDNTKYDFCWCYCAYLYFTKMQLFLFSHLEMSIFLRFASHININDWQKLLDWGSELFPASEGTHGRKHLRTTVLMIHCVCVFTFNNGLNKEEKAEHELIVEHLQKQYKTITSSYVMVKFTNDTQHIATSLAKQKTRYSCETN